MPQFKVEAITHLLAFFDRVLIVGTSEGDGDTVNVVVMVNCKYAIFWHWGALLRLAGALPVSRPSIPTSLAIAVQCALNMEE
jgi:hypothetical protein